MEACPTCGTSTNSSGEPMTERGIRFHHAKVHGESLTVQTYTCDECGDEFERQPSDVRSEKVFCCYDCKVEWWDKGVVENRDWLYDGFYEPRRKALERDEVCRRCGHDGSENRLEVHHIKPVRAYEDPQDAHNLLNLAVLCSRCHGIVEAQTEVEG